MLNILLPKSADLTVVDVEKEVLPLFHDDLDVILKGSSIYQSFLHLSMSDFETLIECLQDADILVTVHNSYSGDVYSRLYQLRVPESE